MKSLLLLGIGGCAGYFVGRHFARENLENKFIRQLDEEGAKYKKYYEDLYEKKIAEAVNEKNAADTEAVILDDNPELKDAAEALTRYQGKVSSIFDDPRPEPQVEDVVFPFSDPTPTTIAPPDGPYIISEDDYVDNKLGYDQQSVTYFAGDAVVVDVHDQTLADTLVDRCIGRHNLEQFGSMSNDDDLVYVRYDHFRQDFEIVRDERKSSVVVSGLTEDD